MTRAQIEASPNLSPLAKLLARVVGDLPQGVIFASAIGKQLATMDSEVIEAAFELRRAGILSTRSGDVSLPIAQILLTPAARAAYDAANKGAA